MSSTAPSASHSPSTGQTQAAHAAARNGAQGARKPGGQETGADLFANLLSLLSASDALPADGGVPGELMQDTAETPPAADGSGEAQLEAMMAWAALPSASVPGAPGAPGAAGAAGAAAAADTLASGTAPGQRVLTGPAPDAGTPLQAAASEAAPADTLQGLQVLDQPEALDEQTQAQLSAANASPPAAGNSAPAPAAARPAAWRSTAQMAGTSALQQWHHTQAQSGPAAERAAVRIDTGPSLPLHSTVALDQRFAQTINDETTPDTPLAAAALPSAVPMAGGADHTGQPGTGGEAGADSGDPTDTRDGLRSDARDETYEETLAQADAEAEERLDSFASPHLRQASLRIGEDGENAIDVRLSLTGQELDLSFRTDSAEARAELRQNAEGTLADLLQRGGIQLGDVNVSDQRGQQGQGGPSASPVRPGAPSARADTAAAPAGSALPATPRPRSDGNRPLDLFV
ncbi:flagellar hook-length control protein FliK [Hydrogenophaga flava]|uniref:flagellar hook-length control protein FliK n=1 Tax=Hydrogenophaga flava TaxID=65657 RepID=UPI0008253D89|nr:flagellar hook-length control protein FliK [Hydrogenophaga flava]